MSSTSIIQKDVSYKGERKQFIINLDEVSEFRILVLSNSYPRFLGGNFIHSQTQHLIKAGYEARVIVPVPYYPNFIKFNSSWNFYSRIPKKEIIDSIPIYYPRYIRFPGKWFHSFSCYTQYWGIKRIVKSLIKEFKPNIIHAHPATPAGYAGLMLKKRYNLPLICTIRGSDINTYPLYNNFSMYLTRKFISEADQIVSVSNALKKVAKSIARPKRDIKVVYNGCDCDTFIYRKENRNQIRNKLGIPKNDKVLIFVGRIEKDKGILELTIAFKKLGTLYPDLHLMIIGDGPERLSLNNIFSNSSINKRVHMLGKHPHSEIPKFFSVADILVLPSYFEGLPNVVLEAMACSLPVVASNVGGIPEAVENGKNGLLVDRKDIESLKKAIEYLIKNKHIAEEMGKNGREIIENRFSWQKNSEMLIRIYKESINR